MGPAGQVMIKNFGIQILSFKTSEAEGLIRNGFGIFVKPPRTIHNVWEPIATNSASSESLPNQRYANHHAESLLKTPSVWS